MGNSTGNVDKKSTRSKNDKTENAGKSWNEKGKSNTSKTNNTTRGNKSEDTGERRKTKKISRLD